MPARASDTAIVLIQKGPNPEELKDFRPISLCNVVYKIISKCLVNRLRPWLDSLISQEQSAFVPGRRITNNALIAFKCIHAIQNGIGDRQEFGAYKLDLAKAYDRVDRAFLQSLLEKLGFHHKWVQWVMSCVTSVRYTVRFNGAPFCPFTPTRGLRQGDLLLPYLFLLVADGLSTLIKHQEALGNLQGIRVCRRAPSVSHLLFADDSLLFFHANVAQATVVKSIIATFERCTGQLISPAKCSMLVNEDGDPSEVHQVRQVLGLQRIDFEAKYLGLPTPHGRIRRGILQPMEERFVKRMVSWKERDLSSAAKETLIKSVAEALPTYVMSVFKLPLTLCDDLMRQIRAFWWGSNKGKRKVQPVPWQTMIKPKCYGGMGFKDLLLFNKALLAHQAWRFIHRPDSLCARVLKAKYYPHGALLDTMFAADASPTWRAIKYGLNTQDW